MQNEKFLFLNVFFILLCVCVPPPTSFARYSQMAKLQLHSPLHTLIMFDGRPAAEFQGGHVFAKRHM